MRWALVSAVTVMLAQPVAAQQTQDETLADIRRELSLLYADIQGLRGQLTESGGLTSGVAGNSPLDRLNAIEIQLQRLTSKTEVLEFQINRIVADGTNRVGDLEFRLCELEPNCDISTLGPAPSLGGGEEIVLTPTPAMPEEVVGPELAIGEQGDFERASEALASGDFRSAADQFAAFVQTYPGGPLSARAFYLRGEALEGLGETSQAARAYLDSFSGDPSSDVASQALLRLGVTLAAFGQVPDACVTLGEVGIRFPGDAAAVEAQTQMQTLGCG